jgi:hypothetical protein
MYYHFEFASKYRGSGLRCEVGWAEESAHGGSAVSNCLAIPPRRARSG